MKRRAGVTLLMLFICSIAIASQAQQSLNDRSGRPGTEVFIDVRVLNDKTGKFATGLGKKDFLIYEDGVKREITSFNQNEFPLSIVLLLDLSGSMKDVIDYVKQGVMESLQALRPQDEIALMAFASGAKLVEDFTQDSSLLTSRIRQLSRKDISRLGTSIGEALYQAALHSRKARINNSRRMIVIITDNHSTEIYRAPDQKEITRELLASDATLCGLILSQPMSPDTPRPAAASLYSSGNVFNYAVETGGVALLAGRKEIGAKLAGILENYRNGYTIGYLSSHPKQEAKGAKLKMQLSPDAAKREAGLKILFRLAHARK